MTKLFVIIVNFNSQKDVIPCLKSLIKVYPKINVIIVDNASTDNSLQSINSLEFKSLQVIKNKKNLGFAEGVNKGIRFALKQGAEEVLLLNPDTLPERGFLEPLLANPAEVAGPILKFQRSNDWVYDFGGKVNFWTGRTSHHEYQISNIKYQISPDYVSGACILIRKKVLEKIGFLDERYFLFFEDVDFCLRAKKAGFKVALESKSIMIHNLSEGKAKLLYQFYHLIRSNLIFINTWLPFYRRPIAYFYLLALSFKMLLNRL
ncbi:MAG: glycosyltransferase family 2 protein [Candidatus Shapirobacteria bacterium]|nr:glycosyltransferase family 2 protein [Candidatus Shapirobacteria bacterium]